MFERFKKEKKKEAKKEKTTFYCVNIYLGTGIKGFFRTLDKKLYINTMKKIRDSIQNNRLLVLVNTIDKETFEFPFPREIKMINEYTYEGY
ncbi:hypothetical protein LCGC14_1517660 [marine sediment metagenome]|uniref:Uncharacterized protein n=1 Tax=marine sediment metagenome TaxID=412755 RepID=A0A0F9LF95_9ZZZZ